MVFCSFVTERERERERIKKKAKIKVYYMTLKIKRKNNYLTHYLYSPPSPIAGGRVLRQGGRGGG